MTAKHISVERTNPEVTDKIDAEGKQVKLRAKVTAGTGYRVEARAPTRPDVDRAQTLTGKDGHKRHSMGRADYTDLTWFLENDAVPESRVGRFLRWVLLGLSRSHAVRHDL